MSAENLQDVTILGGGLAGLSLALQLRQALPAVRINVLERSTFPVPEAAFKIGESTVEIAAHYFGEVLGLREHLDTQQIRKFGFRFFFSEGQSDIARCTELGVSRVLPMTSWQLDRGRFENFLLRRAKSQGIDCRTGAVVKQVQLDGEGPHQVEYEQDGERHAITSRWVVDAAGRASILKRKLGLSADNPHDVNACWWRVEGILDPNDWSSDSAWRARCTPPERWRSTNHLCGRGYWVWMIPLASGAHSIGIVADGGIHALGHFKTHESSMQWLREHQPALVQLLERSAHLVKDFRFMRHFAHGCRQVYSGERWAISGEAGVFPDPFYSPGSDFIAISNTYLTDLIRRDLSGKAFAPYAELYQQLLFSFFDNTMTLYRGQYALFGDAQVMPLKVIWDYAYYWSLLAPLAVSPHLTDIATLGRLRATFERARALNLAMQPLLREWGRRNGDGHGLAPLDGRLLDQYGIAWFHALNSALTEDLADRDGFVMMLESNVARMDALARELLDAARRAHPGIDAPELDALLDGIAAPQPPMLPTEWYAGI